jgi:N4-gp56 family major capsid protein
MPFDNTNTNMTNTSGLLPGMQTYYNRELLETMEPLLVHLQFGKEYRMPMNGGLVMQLRKVLPIETKTTKLAEGNPGEGHLRSETEVLMTLDQYGDWGGYTDKLSMSHMDANILERVKDYADAGARSIDTVVRDELATCPNVIYAGGKTGRSALTAEDMLTTDLLLDAVKTLKQNKAKTFDGHYVAIISPAIWRQLWKDPTFVEVAKYQDKQRVYSGEIGMLGGVRLVETTEAKVFEGAGNGGADVASVIVLGQNAYGYTTWKGANPRVIVKPAGSAGTADPLDQISTIGWKMDGFGVKLIQPEYAVRIECGL